MGGVVQFEIGHFIVWQVLGAGVVFVLPDGYRAAKRVSERREVIFVTQRCL